MEFKLIIKKLNNSLSKQEENIFSIWYNESISHRDYYNNVKENYGNEAIEVDLEKGWRELNKKLKARKKGFSYYKYAAAAAIILLITLPFALKKTDFNFEKTPSVTQQPILPGSDKAILTLGDGTQIALEKGKKYSNSKVNSDGENLVYNTDSGRAKETLVAYNYLTIPRGGQFFIQLSDATKVWLNSESQLKYPVAFAKGKTRQVELVYGEAYFDVSPSSDHNGADFKVFNNKQEIHVLGTEFNIKAYKDETNIYTTLIEGKVTVNYDGKKKSLIPSQQSILNSNNNLLIKTVDVYNEISWKEGVFSFEDKSLKEIMKVLSRWYDMEVIFQNKAVEEEEFIGILEKDQKIEEILINIKNFGIINDYEIKNKKVVLE